jgi:uncharacterized membrane protein YcaP (DUF421 family)
VSELGLLTSTAIHTAIVLVALVAGIRIFGKRQIGGMNVYDLVLVLLLANAVQNAMTKGSGNLGVGIVAAGTLLLADRLLGIVFTRQPQLEGQLLGTPTVVVEDGRFVEEHLRREGVTQDEVLAAVRQFGLTELKQVKLAVLEADGSLSVVPVDDPPG